mgnify:CR=1 FL=1
MRIDLNADLGEGFGPWTMGDDDALLAIVSSANGAKITMIPMPVSSVLSSV